MLERKDAIMNEALEPIPFVLTYSTVSEIHGTRSIISQTARRKADDFFHSGGTKAMRERNREGSQIFFLQLIAGTRDLQSKQDKLIEVRANFYADIHQRTNDSCAILSANCRFYGSRCCS
jgi:hypothetical protein